MIYKNKYDFEVVESYSEDIVENIIKLHKKRWLDEMQLSVFFDKRRVDFMHSILKDYAKLGYLRLFLLKDGERIVSYISWVGRFSLRTVPSKSLIS